MWLPASRILCKLQGSSCSRVFHTLLTDCLATCTAGHTLIGTVKTRLEILKQANKHTYRHCFFSCVCILLLRQYMCCGYGCCTRHNDALCTCCCCGIVMLTSITHTLHALFWHLHVMLSYLLNVLCHAQAALWQCFISVGDCTGLSGVFGSRTHS